MGEPKKLEVKPNKKVKIRNINKYRVWDPLPFSAVIVAEIPLAC